MPGPRYALRTYGCQMNVHDSEKLANLLHHAGFEGPAEEDSADLLLINTCSIRDKAEHRLYSDLGLLAAWKAAAPGRAIGVGGCVAQQEGGRILRRFRQVDFVFGTHNLRLVPAMASGALQEGRRSLNVAPNRSLDRFDLPAPHPDRSVGTPGRSYVTVMEGCDMFCSFCIVPRTRGREISRPAASILEEVQSLGAAGVQEITLLGQTVNAYGRHDERRGQGRDAGTVPFARLLKDLDAVPEIRRIRYTSPHPVFFDSELIRAHGELDSLCPHVHLPLQSGSDRVLAAMRRRYGRHDFLQIVRALRAARSDLAITTDLIVGFPGETEADFEQTLELVEEVGFVDHYSFKYSPRPGTAALQLATPVAGEVAQARLEKLQALQQRLTLDYHRGRVGDVVDVLIEGPSRRGQGQQCGRDPYHRVVNLVGSEGEIEPGSVLRVEVVEATKHSLIGTAFGREGDRNDEREKSAGPLLWIEGAPVRSRAGAS